MNNKRKRPPGPSLFSFIGKPIPDASTFHLNLLHQYGAISKVPGLLNYYLISHPDYVEYIFKTQPTNYIKTDSLYKGIRSVLGDGLLCIAQHEKWLSERKILQPLFHSHVIKNFVPTLVNSTFDYSQRWLSSRLSDKPLNLLDEMLTLVLHNSIKTIFGNHFADHEKIILEFGRLANLYVYKGLFLYPWLPTLTSIKFHQVLKKLEALIKDEIRKPHNPESMDLISLLTNAKDPLTQQPLSEQQIIDEIKTFLVTSFETTGTVLTWAWYSLGTQLECQTLFHEELKHVLNGKMPEINDIEKLNYTRMIFSETMRLYPPIWIISRKSVQEDWIGDYYVPANKMVIVSSFTLHRHPDFWHDPLRFDPMRFSAENNKTRPYFAYIPFGAGPRACIGSHYSLLQGMIMMSVLGQLFEFEVLNKQPPGFRYLITLRPKEPIWVRVKQRS